MGAREPSPAEWAVLAVVAEQRTHGFEVARALEPEGQVGQVWSVSRPLVYRALEALERDGSIAEAGTETGPTGPPRRMLAVTDAGAARLRRWLDEPVEHVRDARSQLLLKLLFLDRFDADPGPLAHAQRERFGAQLAGLEERLARAAGFDATALRWRIASTRAALEFLESLPERAK